MRLFAYLLPLSILMTSCGDSPTLSDESTVPRVPAALVDTDLNSPNLTLKDASLRELYPHLISHPWLQHQSKDVEVGTWLWEDLRLTDRLWQDVSAQLAHRTGSAIPREAFRKQMVKTLLGFQEPSRHLDIVYPNWAYSMLNIPPVNSQQYQSPYPFRMLKRVVLGESKLGFPMYLDTRDFECPEEWVQQILEWHRDCLEKEDSSFADYVAGHWKILAGRGARNRAHLDTTHGFALRDRGMLIAYRYSDGHL
ncbi:MAG: hypothetical protein KDK78_03530, partial [Chlamydiia bacterium]|nr:hypothetical protein [Chlamydiia bacterium]